MKSAIYLALLVGPVSNHLSHVDADCVLFESDSETAWAYDETGTCFDDLGLTRWGWYDFLTVGTKEYDLYAGAAQCDLTKGTHVGYAQVTRDATGLTTVSFDVFDGVLLSEGHVWSGETELPYDGSSYSAAPGGFNHKDGDITNNDLTYEFTEPDSTYISIHATVSGSGEIGEDCVSTDDSTDESTDDSAGANGDPHFTLWGGHHYDFHGACDLVLVKNSEFNDGLGLDIHLRTKFMKHWSYIDSAVLRIGKDTLEVKGSKEDTLYWINGEFQGDISQGIGGFSLEFEQPNSLSKQFIVNTGEEESIVIRTFKELVRVDIVDPSIESFGKSEGMIGSFPMGEKLGRDQQTLFDDDVEFGKEWQVLADEDMLFHNVEGVQAPEPCAMPDEVTSVRRRRLGESTFTEAEANLACAHVKPGFFDNCVFDVLIMDDLGVAGAY